MQLLRTSQCHTTISIIRRIKCNNIPIFLLFLMQPILFSTRLQWIILMVPHMDLFITMMESVWIAMRNNQESILSIKLKIKIKVKLTSLNWMICMWTAQWMNKLEISRYLVHSRIQLIYHFRLFNCSLYRNQPNLLILEFLSWKEQVKDKY